MILQLVLHTSTEEACEDRLDRSSKTSNCHTVRKCIYLCVYEWDMYYYRSVLCLYITKINVNTMAMCILSSTVISKWWCNQMCLQDHQCFITISCLPLCSAGTDEDADLELLVDDFVTFYIAGEWNLIRNTFSMPVELEVFIKYIPHKAMAAKVCPPQTRPYSSEIHCLKIWECEHVLLHMLCSC